MAVMLILNTYAVLGSVAKVPKNGKLSMSDFSKCAHYSRGYTIILVCPYLRPLINGVHYSRAQAIQGNTVFIK